LIINELVLNAGRHAYPDCPDGLIRLQLVLMDRAVSISVSDDGVGLPTDFNPALTKRLGTRIVQALAGQLGAELTRQESTVALTTRLSFRCTSRLSIELCYCNDSPRGGVRRSPFHRVCDAVFVPQMRTVVKVLKEQRAVDGTLRLRSHAHTSSRLISMRRSRWAIGISL
jgi:hypothetical protein